LIATAASVLIIIFFCSCCSHLEHRASVKRFVSLQFLNIAHSVGLLGRRISPSQGPYLTQTHPCLEWESNPRSQCSSGRSPRGLIFITRMVFCNSAQNFKLIS
jgi:hypothetical protein